MTSYTTVESVRVLPGIGVLISWRHGASPIAPMDSLGGEIVGELLAVDLGELRALGRTLVDAASTMNGICVTATVTMPGSPVAADSEQCTRSTAEAYTRIALNVNEMSATCEWSATSYENVDEAFSSQLLRYEAGAPR